MSKILQFKALEKKIAEDTAVFESLRAELEVVGRIGEYVRNEAAKEKSRHFIRKSKTADVKTKAQTQHSEKNFQSYEEAH